MILASENINSIKELTKNQLILSFMDAQKFFKLIFIVFLQQIVFVRCQPIYKAPQFFCSFLCTLGTASGTTGNFTCLTPYVIPIVYKHGASMAQTTKVQSGQVQNYMLIYPSSTINATSFLVSFYYAGLYNMYLSYFIIAIGNQPSNTWVDMVGVFLQQYAPTNSLMGGQNTVRFMSWQYSISTYTFFNDLSDLTLVNFISSFVAITYSSPFINQIDFTSGIINSTVFTTKLQVQPYVALKYLLGFVLFYRSSEILTNQGVYQHDGFTFSSNAANYFDFTVSYPSWGPRFNTKCLLGYWSTAYLYDQNFNFKFINSSKLNFYKIQFTGNNTANTVFKGNTFCLSDTTIQCGQTLNYFDKLNNSCHSASLCPVNTTDSLLLPSVPQTCNLCIQQNCLNCLNLDRNYCILCDPISYSSNISGDCKCISGYYNQTVNTSYACSLNCSYWIPQCKLQNCTAQTFCTQCNNGYFLQYNANLSQTCQICSSAINNCTSCSNSSFCSQCQNKFYPNSSLIGFSNCVFCNSSIPYCDICSNSSNCTTCFIGYVKTVSGCQCNFSLMTGCGNCTIPTQCTLCIVGYYLQPNTSLCQLCTTLFQCVNCISYNRCTKCNSFYAPLFNNITNETKCQTCSSLISNCVNCSSSSICNLCDTGYGVSNTSKCTLCSTLHKHCIGCLNYTKCLQCQINNQTFSHNGTCLKCSDLDGECINCLYDGTGIQCTECSVGYYLNPFDHLCYKCSDSIWDCQQCQFDISINNTKCTLCSSLFLLDSNFTCQICKKDTYVTRTCTNVIGCKSSHFIKGQTICLSCDGTLNFEYNFISKNCTCQQGFQFNKLAKKCDQKCGDGIKMYMECDDGNSINQDGCSDQCLIQANFICNQDKNKLSSCVLNQEITIIFQYILKEDGQNRAKLYFTVSPKSTVLNKVNWKAAINFNFSQPIKTSIFYQNGILIVTLDYFSDIQGKNLMLIPIVLTSLVYFGYSLKRYRQKQLFQSTHHIIHKDNYTMTTRSLNFIYDNFIFSYTLGLLYIALFSSLIYCLAHRQSDSLYSSFYIFLSYVSNLFFLIIIFAIFSFEAINGIQRVRQQKSKNSVIISKQKSITHDANTTDLGFHPMYVSIYLFYQLGLICIMMSYFSGLAYTLQVILGVSFIYLIILLSWKPYKLKLHNYSIIYYEVAKIIFFSSQILLKYNLIGNKIYSIVLYIILTFILIALILQVVRLYYQRKYEKNQVRLDSPQRQGLISKDQNINKSKVLQTIKNPFLFQNQINRMDQFQRQHIEKNIFGKWQMKKTIQQQNKKRLNNQLINKKKINIKYLDMDIEINNCDSIYINCNSSPIKKKDKNVMDNRNEENKNEEINKIKYKIRQTLNDYQGY